MRGDPGAGAERKNRQRIVETFVRMFALSMASNGGGFDAKH